MKKIEILGIPKIKSKLEAKIDELNENLVCLIQVTKNLTQIIELHKQAITETFKAGEDK